MRLNCDCQGRLKFHVCALGREGVKNQHSGYRLEPVERRVWKALRLCRVHTGAGRMSLSGWRVHAADSGSPVGITVIWLGACLARVRLCSNPALPRSVLPPQ